MASSGVITGRQIKAARALLGWRQADLAGHAKISEMSVKNVERGLVDARSSTIAAIETAFKKHGIVFLDHGDTRSGGQGVRLRK